MENIEQYLIEVIKDIVNQFPVKAKFMFDDRDSTYVIFVNCDKVPLEDAFKLKMVLRWKRRITAKDFPESSVIITTKTPHIGTGKILYHSDSTGI